MTGVFGTIRRALARVAVLSLVLAVACCGGAAALDIKDGESVRLSDHRGIELWEVHFLGTPSGGGSGDVTAELVADYRVVFDGDGGSSNQRLVVADDKAGKITVTSDGQLTLKNNDYGAGTLGGAFSVGKDGMLAITGGGVFAVNAAALNMPSSPFITDYSEFIVLESVFFEAGDNTTTYTVTQIVKESSLSYGDGSVEISGNTVAWGGGGGYNNGTLVAERTRYVNNTAGYGGAIFSDDGSTLKLADTLFKENTSTSTGSASDPDHGGGALYLKGDVEVVMGGANNIFRDNSSETVGGAIRFAGHDDAALIVENGSTLLFDGNTAADGGSAVYADNAGGNVSLRIGLADGADTDAAVDLVFQNNHIRGSGGSGTGDIHGAVQVYSANGTATLELQAGKGDVTFAGNTTYVMGVVPGYGWGYGGGISVTAEGDATAVIRGGTVSFIGNAVSERGGAVYVDSKDGLAKLEIDATEDILFSGNYSGYGGGIFLLYGDGDSEVTLTAGNSIVFSNNSAAYGAGGLSGGRVTLHAEEAISFSSNRANDGYGGAIAGGSVVTPDEGFIQLSTANGDIRFDSNRASEEGGAIYSEGDLDIAAGGDVVFTGNASLKGGAIHSAGNVDITAGGNVTFVGNSSGQYGGGAIFSAGDVTITDVGSVVFSGNISKKVGSETNSGHGGAIQSDASNGTVSLTNASFIGNSAEYEGGAIYLNGSGATLKMTVKEGRTALVSGNIATSTFDSNFAKFRDNGEFLAHVEGNALLDMRDPFAGDGGFSFEKTGEGEMRLGGENGFSVGFMFGSQIITFDVDGGTLHLYREDEVTNGFDESNNPKGVEAGKILFGKSPEPLGDGSGFTLGKNATLSVGGGNVIDVVNRYERSSGTITFEEDSDFRFDAAYANESGDGDAMLKLESDTNVKFEGGHTVDLLSTPVAADVYNLMHAANTNSLTVGDSGRFSDTLTLRGEDLSDSRVGEVFSLIVNSGGDTLQLSLSAPITNQVLTWTGDGDKVWNITADNNWAPTSGGAATKFFAGDIVNFAGSGDTPKTVVVNDHGVQVAGMFASGEGDFAFTGGGITADGSAGTSFANAGAAQGKLVLGGAATGTSPDSEVADAAFAGTVDFTGITGANRFAGGVELRSGTLRISTREQLGADLGGVSFAGSDESVLRIAGDVDFDGGAGNQQIYVDADHKGAVVVEDGATLTLRGSQESAIHVDDDGGFRYTVESGGTLVFENNTVTTGSGGAVNNSGTLSFAGDVVFDGNSADSNGGAIYTEGGTLSLAGNLLFSGNAANNGGAMYIYKTNVDISGSAAFVNNTAADVGGAILNVFSDLTLADAVFNTNSAGYSGGAIYNVGSDLTVKNASFTGNSAEMGGAIYFDATDKTLTLIDVDLYNNTSYTGTSYTGAVQVLGSLDIQVTAGNTSVVSNNYLYNAGVNVGYSVSNRGSAEANKVTIDTGENATLDMRDAMLVYAEDDDTEVVKTGEGMWVVGTAAGFSDLGRGNAVAFKVNEGALRLSRDAYLTFETTTGSSFTLADGARLDAVGGNRIVLNDFSSLDPNGAITLTGGSTLGFALDYASFDVAVLELSAATVDLATTASDTIKVDLLSLTADGDYALANFNRAYDFDAFNGTVTLRGQNVDDTRGEGMLTLVSGTELKKTNSLADEDTLYLTVDSSQSQGNVVNTWTGANGVDWNYSAENWDNDHDELFWENDVVNFVEDADKYEVTIADGGAGTAGIFVSGGNDYTFTGGALTADSTAGTLAGSAAATGKLVLGRWAENKDTVVDEAFTGVLDLTGITGSNDFKQGVDIYSGSLRVGSQAQLGTGSGGLKLAGTGFDGTAFLGAIIDLIAGDGDLDGLFDVMDGEREKGTLATVIVEGGKDLRLDAANGDGGLMTIGAEKAGRIHLEDGDTADTTVALFANNTGGAALVDAGGTLILSGGKDTLFEFNENHSAEAGGAVRVVGTGTGTANDGKGLYVIGSARFTGNASDENGGAISLGDGGSALFILGVDDEVLFSGNTATGAGDSVYLENSALVFINDGVVDIRDAMGGLAENGGANWVQMFGKGILRLAGDNHFQAGTDDGTTGFFVDSGTLHLYGENENGTMTAGSITLDGADSAFLFGNGETRTVLLVGGDNAITATGDSGGIRFEAMSAIVAGDAETTSLTLTTSGADGRTTISDMLGVFVGLDADDEAKTLILTASFEDGGADGDGLHKAGEGILILAGGSSYTGDTVVYEGSLLGGSIGAFSADSMHVLFADTLLDLNGNDQTIGGLMGHEDSLVVLGGNTLTVDQNDDSVYEGALTGTALSGLVKDGDGELTLANFDADDFEGGLIAKGGVLALQIALDDFTLANPVSGDATLALQLNSADGDLTFAPAADNGFTGILDLRVGHLALDDDAEAVLGDATLMLSAGGSTTVSQNRSLDGLILNGGAYRRTDAVLTVIDLDITANGGVVMTAIPDNFNTDALHADNLFDYAGMGTKVEILVEATGAVTGAGTQLQWLDLDGNLLPTISQSDIVQGGTVTGLAHMGYIATVEDTDAPKGIHLGVGLEAIEALSGKTVILDSTGAASADPRLFARLIGSGGFLFTGDKDILVGNAYSTYTGATTIDGVGVTMLANTAFGNTSLLNLVNGGTLFMDGKEQVVGALTGEADTAINLGTEADNAGVLIAWQNVDSTYDGFLEGFGEFCKAGSGLLNLTADNVDFEGVTYVRGGGLLVNGTLAGPVAVSPYNSATAFLGGGGTILGDVFIGAGGSLAPGNSIGTITIDGDLAYEAGSFYDVEIDPTTTSADKTVVTGEADLAGATVRHTILYTGGTILDSGAWRILETDGGFTSRFAGLANTYYFFDSELVYADDSQWVDLTLARNGNGIGGSDGDTTNQKETGRGIESVIDNGGGDLIDQIINLPGDVDYQDLRDQMSGEIHASAHGAVMGYDRAFARALRQRLTRRECQTLGYPLWASFDGHHNVADGTGNTARAKFKGYGVSVGAERRAGAWIGGLAFRYGDNELKVDKRHSKADIDSYSVAAYLGGDFGKWRARLGGSYGWHDVASRRRIVVPALAQTNRADYDMQSWQAFGEIAYAQPVSDRAVLEPYVGGSWAYTKNGRFVERGGTAALRGAGMDNHGVVSSVGARLQYQVVNKAWLEADVSWQHLYGKDRTDNRFSFANGNRFTVNGAPLDRDMVGARFGVVVEVNSRFNIRAHYDGLFGSDNTSHSGSITLDYTF